MTVRVSSIFAGAWRSCVRADGVGKTPYHSRRRALEVARRVARESHDELHSYRCSACGHWHLARDWEGETA